ncbi:hypothetical protein CAOG_06925 [Capsaspora owczarzaki ATCC 30864]|uniref:Uncharacterized protein n=1 Tax=Capsaspora owczarzaki (strain ATCC 30864) TaxID=595528 RepID=A0A0D2WV55_CAPO3|nr:hypothetical protein CAOG_06925 [Capsaspora owczarzaki ATCC 30864]KJE96625.1 hypothetical protein CAOG_006925 [Capsaspora owczarzaki ATCC 30864]|eukprot:XP_004344546.1 hypothetical protein CAOG_06925 [Capsaspora owczarzaki ATCC 30864]
MAAESSSSSSSSSSSALGGPQQLNRPLSALSPANNGLGDILVPPSPTATATATATPGIDDEQLTELYMTSFGITRDEASRILLLRRKLVQKGFLSSTAAATPAASDHQATQPQAATTSSSHNSNVLNDETVLLAKFLFAREFNVEKALALYTVYMNHFGITQRFAVDVMDSLRDGTLYLPGSRDKDNAAVLVVAAKLQEMSFPSSPAFSASSSSNLSAILDLASYLLDIATTDTLTQRNGIVVVVDLSRASWKQFDASLQSQLFGLMDEKYPVRLRRIYLVNAPWWLSMAMKTYKAVMSAPLAAKLEVVDNNASLAKIIPPTSLPSDFGGSLPYNHEAFVDQRVQAETDLLAAARREGYVYQLVPTSDESEEMFKRQLSERRHFHEQIARFSTVFDDDVDDPFEQMQAHAGDDSTSGSSTPGSPPQMRTIAQLPASMSTSLHSVYSLTPSMSSESQTSAAAAVKWVRRYFVTRVKEMIITVYRTADDAAALETIDLHKCSDIVVDERTVKLLQEQSANNTVSSTSSPAAGGGGGGASANRLSTLSTKKSDQTVTALGRGAFVSALDSPEAQNSHAYFGFHILGIDGTKWSIRLEGAREFEGWMASLRGKMNIVREERRRREEELARRQKEERELKERLEKAREEERARLAQEEQELRERQEREAREEEERAREAVRLAREERIRTLHPKRTNIVQELLATEQSYVNNLVMVVDFFIKPLRATIETGKPLVTNADLKKMFPDLESIVNINKQLLAELAERVENWSAVQKIGDIFLKMAVYLKVYTGFVSNFPMATELISRLTETSAPFKAFLKETESRPECKRLGLLQHMLTPIQRIPRYVLLLEDLAKRTDPEHVDYADITAAVKQVKELANFINETKRQAESRAMMVAIQKDVKRLPEGFELLQPQRRLISDTHFIELEILSGSRQYTPGHTIIVYLFSDLALFVQRKKKKQGVSDGFRAKSALSDIHVVPLPDVGENTNLMQISAGDLVVIAQATSKRIRDDWIAQLKDTQRCESAPAAPSTAQ